MVKQFVTGDQDNFRLWRLFKAISGNFTIFFHAINSDEIPLESARSTWDSLVKIPNSCHRPDLAGID